MKRTCRYCPNCLQPVYRPEAAIYNKNEVTLFTYCLNQSHTAYGYTSWNRKDTLNSNEAHKQMRARGIAKGYAYGTQKH